MSLQQKTWNIALTWAAFRMIADLTWRTASALATPAALAFLAWILCNKN